MKTPVSKQGRVLLLTLALALAGCSSRPGPEVLVPVANEAEGANSVTVYTASTRERADDGLPLFTAERSRQTNYGAFTISVPPDHVPGRVEWPNREPDPATSFAVTDHRQFDGPDFIDAVAQSADGQRHAVSIFIHGYNQSFQQALFRMGQMTVDGHHEGAAVLFAWPSQAAVAGYVADKDSAAYSRDYLADMLTMMARDRRIGDINLVAHSMGGWLTVEALRQLRLSGRHDVLERLHVVLASPDIDVDLFRAQMDVIGSMPQPMVVLVAPDDRALRASRRLGSQNDRLGALDITDPRVQETATHAGVAIVDITSLEAADGLRHGRYALLGSVLAELEESGTVTPGQGLRQAGAFVFNTVGTTISSPFVLVGEALAAE